MKLTKKYIASIRPKRPKYANKGTFGKVLVVAGSENYPGAAYLSCTASYRVGAGLVTLATEPEVKIIVSRKLPEVTFITWEEIHEKLSTFDVLLLGPGLGQKEPTINFLQQLLMGGLPKTVIDGDGLNILSKIADWWKMISSEVILTPHPGEMARLTGLTIDQIQSDRVKISQSFAKKWNKIVVLKGANTVLASPDGQLVISPFVNPLLATAGTGDVLAGMIAGFWVQGLNCFDAACCGVFIHGLAAESLKKKFGDSGMLAGDLLSMIPIVVKNLKT